MVMESLLAKALMSISGLSFLPRLGASEDARVGNTLAKELSSQIPMKISCRVPKRIFLLGSVGLSSALLYKCSTIAEPLAEMADTETIRPRKMTSGVKFLDMIEGMGPEAHEGDLVKVNYVCRRSNGYFVHSTVDQFTGESNPIILPLDDKIIKGLKEILVGMKVGGKRRAVIPPNVGYTNENLQPIPDEFGHRRRILSHSNEPLVFEVQLLKIL
ncbi:peptidyl-prolyl cis-trans isomerase FKBP16-1, chloroplastic [Nymphaea colorata]|nr:peptidyl-prolyl cis-trans isomerase FKBP16-1, chloroplastic [Nymphaea colorata]